jgi:hypothetical protein
VLIALCTSNVTLVNINTLIAFLSGRFRLSFRRGRVVSLWGILGAIRLFDVLSLPILCLGVIGLRVALGSFLALKQALPRGLSAIPAEIGLHDAIDVLVRARFAFRSELCDFRGRIGRGRIGRIYLFLFLSVDLRLEAFVRSRSYADIFG